MANELHRWTTNLAKPRVINLQYSFEWQCIRSLSLYVSMYINIYMLPFNVSFWSIWRNFWELPILPSLASVLALGPLPLCCPWAHMQHLVHYSFWLSSRFCPGPIQYILYTADLKRILLSIRVAVHQYADDSHGPVDAALSLLERILEASNICP